ncbi:MAG: glycosyltransferase family 9 protein [Phycisphaerales bacterium]
MRTVPRRILIVRPSAFGDVCRTVPLLWSLRKTFPKAVIDWVVEDRWSPAIQEHPAIDGVVKFPKREFRSCWRNPKTAIKTIQWFWRLRRGRYDLVIDAQGLARSGLMSLVTGAKVRVANRSGREFSWIAANRRVNRVAGSHVVDAMLQLVAEVGVIPIADMRLVTPSTELVWWRDETARRNIVGPFVVIAAGNGWEGKRWVAQRWSELLRAVADDFVKRGIQDVVWIGAPGEEAQVAELCNEASSIARLRSHNLAGLTTVGGTMAVIQNASLVIALDSAPAHLAVGFGVPLVALYGASQPSIDGPYQSQMWCAHGGRGEELGRHDHRDPQKGREMMERITTEEVVALVRKRLQGGAES